jgi:hypothetical protein
VLEFLPMIMNLIQGQKKEKEAQNQNSMSAMLGQAPTGQQQSGGGGDMGGALGSAVGGLLQKKAPGHGMRHNGLSADTDNMLDEGLGKMDGDEDDKDLLSM